MSDFIHARTLDTRWGQALAYLNNDDDYYSEVLALRVWAPVGEGGALALVEAKLGFADEVSDEAAEALEEANRSALRNMDASKFEAAFASAGIADMLDKAFATRAEQVPA